MYEEKAYHVDMLIKGGPYSHVVEAGEFLFVSGMVPIQAQKQLMVTDDIKKATELVLDNIKRALESAGSNLDKVVKVTVDCTPIIGQIELGESHRVCCYSPG